MKISGNLRKMKVKDSGGVVDYSLRVIGRDNQEQFYQLNESVGKKISIKSLEVYHCVNCDKETKKSFSQGYCFQCFSTLAECDMCIVKPETCHYNQGTCREPRWAERYCMRPHYVYLANSSGLKVGITRETQIPTRWMDQGATQALPIAKVATRHLSGILEIELAKKISDKTNWRQMLQGESEKIDLKKERDSLIKLITPSVEKYGGEILDEKMHEFNYPVEQYPQKITSLSLEKTPTIKGILKGIKGQYLILDTGVINLRKYNALLVEIDV